MSRSKLPSKIATGNLPENSSETIYDLIGFKEFNYKQKTKAEYSAFLGTLPTSDLQRHAVENGVIPNAVSRQTIIGRLETLYSKRLMSSVDRRIENKVAKLNNSDEAEIAKFLASAR